MAERTWTVRVNLDDLGAQMLALDDDAERGAWLTGFQVGAAGAPCRDTWSDAKRRGWEFGVSSYNEAMEFRSKKAAAGEASANARRAKTGSAQPPRQDQNSTGSERCSSGVRTNLEQDIEHAPNQPTANSQQPTTENEQQQSPPAPQGGATEVVDLWNAAVDGSPLPKARVTPTRSKTIATRLKERGWLDDFRASLAYLTTTPWYRGENDRGWIADLDFLLQPGKATQLAEKSRSPVVAPRAPVQRFGPAPSVRRSADEQWAAENPEMLKPYTPKDGANEPAY